jgi:hypothetical protein
LPLPGISRERPGTGSAIFRFGPESRFAGTPGISSGFDLIPAKTHPSLDANRDQIVHD